MIDWDRWPEARVEDFIDWVISRDRDALVISERLHDLLDEVYQWGLDEGTAGTSDGNTDAT